MPADRECVAQIPPEACDVWRSFCTSQRLDRAPLVEVIGYWLEAHPDHPLVAQWVNETADLMADRNRRRG